MHDFTLKTYRLLLKEFLSKGYGFIRFDDSLNENSKITHNSLFTTNNSPLTTNRLKICVLRHDVDRLPENALGTAEIENELGIKGTYYFRIVPESYNLKIMEKISHMGHEIGYHYEDVDLVNSKLKGKNEELQKKDKEKYLDLLIDLAYESFCKNLEMLRKNFDIKTICMHGSPKSKYDNKLVWTKYDYRDLGIWGEPYFDIDFNKFAYFTDTGRRWNGDKIIIRDKVNSKFKFNFKTTKEIINNIEKLPGNIMFTMHPERWTNNLFLWSKELIWQNTKNLFKWILAKKNE